jgi:hypothetical protein
VTARGSVYSVYRRRNSAVLQQLLAPALDAGWPIALWALDEPDPSLGALTAGCGPGTKFDLVNGLIVESPPAPDDYVVISDDDAVFVGGSVTAFVTTAEAAGLDLAQPAHALRSNISHRITWRRPLSTARLTSFVEIGPLVAIAPEWRDRILPFPDGVGMGWGLDLQWADLHDEGCRLGIVDATPIRHLSPFASAYVPDEEIAKLTQLLEERGTPGWKGVRRTFATWRPWRKRPPWLAQPASSSRS